MRRKNAILRRILSFMLVLAMMIGVVPANVFAEPALADEITDAYYLDGAGEKAALTVTKLDDVSINSSSGVKVLPLFEITVPEGTEKVYLESEESFTGVGDYTKDGEFVSGQLETSEKSPLGVPMADLLGTGIDVALYDESWDWVCAVRFASAAVAVESVILDKTEATLEVGATATLTVTVAPENATDKTVTWSSSDDSVATVVDGVVTAVAAGTATITAKAGEMEATCEVTVNESAVAVESVTLDKTETTLAVGKTATLTATVAPENATDKTVTWSSSDDSVATVVEGVVTAVAAGTATITAKAGEMEAACTVKVKSEEGYEVTVNVAPSTAEVTFYAGSDTTKALTTEVKDNGVVDNYHQYILTVPKGTYTYRGVDGETDLGGMTFDVPFDEEIMSDGTASGEGLKLVLRRVNYYTTNAAVTAVGDYTLRLIPGIMPEPVNGTQYIDDNNRVVTPVLMMARGNAITFQQYITINGDLAEDYTVAPVSNVTFGAGTSALNKTFSVKNYVCHTVIAPQDAEVKVFNQINNFNVEEVTNRTVSEPDEDGMITYVYKTAGGSNLTYRVSMEGKITRAGYFGTKAETVTVTFEENENPKTTELKLDNANIQKRMESSTLLNVNGQNNLSLGVGENYRLRAYRAAWQIINTDTANIMIEPDFHYNVISGGEHISIDVVDDVCTGNATGNWMDIKGVSAGVAVLEICYDAIRIGGDGTSYDGLYGATDPQRKGLVIIQVGGGAKTLKMYADGRANTWDAEFDTVYFLEDTGSLTFTATLGEDTPESVELSTDNGNTWSTVTAADGKYTANGLVGGNNVLRFKKGDTVEYQVVRAAKVTRTITNLTRSEGIIAGDQLKVVYSGLYTPIAKISGIYNPGFGQGHKVTYTVPEGFTVVQAGGQYDFISTNAYTITIPETASGEYTFADGYVYFNVMGVDDPLGGHRILTDTGCGTNFSAVSTMHERSILPDLTFEVMELPKADVTVTADVEGAAIVVKNSDGTELIPENGQYINLPIGNYSYIVSLEGYITARGSFTVTLKDAEAKTKTVAIAMRKIEGAIWNGTTKTEPSKDQNGVYLIGTGAELAWFAANHGNANAVLTADISLGGFNWTPITAYAGIFDGNGHWVTDLYIDATSASQGLFAQLSSNGVVKNLGVRGQVTSTGNYVGGIIGVLRNVGTVSNCVSDVVVTGGRYVGGIVGQQYMNSVISNCYNLNMITSTNKSGNAGGISGGYSVATQTYTIENCYNIGTVTAAKNYGSIAYTTSATNIVNSYYVGNNGTSNYGTAATKDGLKGMAETLGDAYVADEININDGYPVLKWQVPAADIAVTGVTLDKTEATLEVGETETLTATVTPDNATDKTVTWTSSDEAVATVKDGVVTAVAAGTATITATAGEVSATCEVTVTKVQPLISVKVGGKEVELTTFNTPYYKGIGYQMTLEELSDIAITGKDTLSDSLLDGVKKEWFQKELTENTVVFTVEELKALAGAKTEFEKCEDWKNASAEWKTEGKNVVAISFNDSSFWGYTILLIEIPDVIEVESVTLDKEELTLVKGRNATLTATVAPEEATDSTVTWTTSDESVATVKDGVVTAVAAGTATITATAGTKTAECKVAVKEIVVPEGHYQVTVKVGPKETDVKFYSDANATNSMTENVYDEGIVDGYHQYTIVAPEGKYSYRGFEGEQTLGGMEFNVPIADEYASDGTLMGKGQVLNLKRVNFYTQSEVVTKPGDFKVRLYPQDLAEAVGGDSYVSADGYVTAPVLVNAAGNAITYQCAIDLNGELANTYAVTPMENITFGPSTATESRIFSVSTATWYSITAPAEAKAQMFRQNNNYNVTEIPAAKTETLENGTVKTSFATPGGQTITYRVTMKDKVTRAGFATTSNKDMLFEFAANEDPKSTKTTAARIENSSMLNINTQNNLSLSVGETFRLRSFRAGWQIINTDTANIMIEPDFHYNIISGAEHITMSPATNKTTGNAGSGENTNWMDITAVSAGMVVLEVSYDAIQIGGDTYYPGLFGAVDPSRKSVVVINIGEKQENTLVVTPTDGSGTDYTWDVDFDTVYFTEDTGNFNFKATMGGASVDKVELSTDLGATWKVVEENNGIYAAKGLISGNNILKVTKGNKVEYQVVRASKLTVTAVNMSRSGDTIIAGDKVRVIFSGIYTPVPKMSGIYNPGFSGKNQTLYTVPEGATAESSSSQYGFAADNQYNITFTEAKTYKFTGGYITSSVMGDNAGEHRAITDAGRGTNFNAGSEFGYRSIMPDLTFEVIEMPVVDVTVKSNPEGAVLEIKDVAGTVLEPNENGEYELEYGTYSYKATKEGYVPERGKFTVGGDDRLTGKKTVTITLRPVGGEIWDGTTKTEPQKNEDGAYLIGTGEELAWFAANHGNANAILTSDISLGGFSVKISSYKGIFDGNGHYINDYYGSDSLFFYVGSGAVIKNLGISGEIVSTTTYMGPGGIAQATGNNVKFEVQNCVSRVEVTGASGTTGGIVGNAHSGSNTNCPQISNCYNAGTVKGSGYGYVGGIAGYKDSNPCSWIKNCYNIGTVSDYGIARNGRGTRSNNYTLLGASPNTGGTAVEGDVLKTYASTLGDAYMDNPTSYNDGYPILTWEEPRAIKAAAEDYGLELAAYKNKDDYRPAQQEELAAAIEAGKAAIAAVESLADVDEAFAAAKAEIDKIKTDAQLTQEEAESKVGAAVITSAKTWGYNAVKVSWAAADNADGYELEYRTGNGAWDAVTTVEDGTATSYVHTKLTTGKTYEYRIRPYRVVNEEKVYGEYSNEVSGKPVPKKAVITKTAKWGYNAIKVTWNKVNGASGYRLYYREQGTTSWKYVTQISSGSTLSYVHTGVRCGTTYEYRMRAYRTVDGEKVFGAYSAVVIGRTIPKQAVITSVEKASNTSMKLTWNKVAGATGYRLYYREKGETSWKYITQIGKGTTLTYTHKGLKKGKTYDYIMRAYRTVDGEKVFGSYSAVKSGKIK